MPRSVNSVAAKARRKKILKQAKGYFGRRKTFTQLLKMQLIEDLLLLTETESKTKQISVHYGLQELTQVQESTE